MTTIKTLAISAVAAGLLFGTHSAYAQSGAALRQAAAKKDNTTFDVPKSMKVEHDELHSNLARLTKAGGRTGEAAKSVAKVLDPHFANENAYALPPLGLLVPLSRGQVRMQYDRRFENDGQARSRDADHAFRAQRDRGRVKKPEGRRNG